MKEPLISARNFNSDAIFLNSVIINGLEGCYYHKEFVINHNVKQVNEIFVESEEDARMWCSFIEILTNIAEDIEYPDLEGTWSLTIEYSSWSLPVDLYTKADNIIRVVIECNEGKITESAYVVEENNLILIPNHDHASQGFSHLDHNIIEDLGKLNFYRWNPRIKDYYIIQDYANYFLKLHDDFVRRKGQVYIDEIQSMVEFINPVFSARIEFQVLSSNQYKYTIFKDTPNFNEDRGIDVRNMDDDFQNFFYSYSEFKSFKDENSGTMGLFMLNAKSQIYVEAYKKALEYSDSRCKSQFFFIQWNKEKIQELKQTMLPVVV